MDEKKKREGWRGRESFNSELFSPFVFSHKSVTLQKLLGHSERFTVQDFETECVSYPPTALFLLSGSWNINLRMCDNLIKGDFSPSSTAPL